MSRSFFILAGGLGAVALLVYFGRRGKAAQARESETDAFRIPRVDTGSAIGDVITDIGTGFLALGVSIGAAISGAALSFFPEAFLGDGADLPAIQQNETVILAARLSGPPWNMSSESAFIVAGDILSWIRIGTGPVNVPLLSDGVISTAIRDLGLAPAQKPLVSIVLNP